MRAGALALWRVGPWLAPGVILAIVDPGVGTSRRAVAVEVDTRGTGGIGARDRTGGGTSGGPTYLVGPDNGLLGPVAARLGLIKAAVALAPGPAEGRTFAGRDVFAPAAARLSLGHPLAALGPPLDPTGLIGEPVPRPVPQPGGGVRAEVLWVDRFGNGQLNVTWGEVEHLGRSLQLRAANGRWPVKLVEAFADLEPGAVGLVVDSYRLLAVCVDRGSGAAVTGLDPGDQVWLQAGPAEP